MEAAPCDACHRCATRFGSKADKKSRMTGSALLILKRAPVGDNQDDYDVLADDVVVGRIMKMQVTPRAKPWFWGIGHSHLDGRSPPTYGYEATRHDAVVDCAAAINFCVASHCPQMRVVPGPQ
jgi:hypothetical protein